MDAFTDFILQVTYPPNPNRPLDNALTADQEAGRQLFDTVNCGIPSAPEFNGAVLTCSSCHVIDPNANPGTAAPGFFGTSGLSSFDFNPQLFKAPHLRNLYQKVGMFGNPDEPRVPRRRQRLQGRPGARLRVPPRREHRHGVPLRTMGSASRTISTGPTATASRTGRRARSSGGSSRRSSWRSPPTWRPSWASRSRSRPASSAAVGARVDLLRQRADAGECDLVAKTRISGDEAGFLYVGSGLFARDRRGQPPITDAALRSLATDSGRPVTYTCVPPGSGERVGVDRDGDGAWDGDERRRSHRSGGSGQQALIRADRMSSRFIDRKGKDP